MLQIQSPMKSGVNFHQIPAQSGFADATPDFTTLRILDGKTGLSRARQSFFLTAPYLSSFNYLQPILAQRPIWRDVPVERLPGNSQFAA
jgi:hypothetical protein